MPSPALDHDAPRITRAASERLVGIIVTALMILVVGFCFATRDVRGPRRSAIVALPRADGIREGASVTYLGLRVGEVERLVIDDRRIVLHLFIQRPDVELRRGDSIRIATLGLLGDRVLELVPGPASAPLLAPGDTLTAMSSRGAAGGNPMDGLQRPQARDSARTGPPAPPP